MQPQVCSSALNCREYRSLGNPGVIVMHDDRSCLAQPHNLAWIMDLMPRFGTLALRGKVLRRMTIYRGSSLKGFRSVCVRACDNTWSLC